MAPKFPVGARVTILASSGYSFAPCEGKIDRATPVQATMVYKVEVDGQGMTTRFWNVMEDELVYAFAKGDKVFHTGIGRSEVFTVVDGPRHVGPIPHYEMENSRGNRGVFHADVLAPLGAPGASQTPEIAEEVVPQRPPVLCPSCGLPGAYIGLLTIECANGKCRHYAPPKGSSAASTTDHFLREDDQQAWLAWAKSHQGYVFTRIIHQGKQTRYVWVRYLGNEWWYSTYDDRPSAEWERRIAEAIARDGLPEPTLLGDVAELRV